MTRKQRSAAAKRGWETRRHNERSRAAKRGWKTRRKHEREQEQKREKRRDKIDEERLSRLIDRYEERKKMKRGKLYIEVGRGRYVLAIDYARGKRGRR